MDIIILISLLVGLSFLIKKKISLGALTSKDVLIGWGVKLGYSLLYLYIFIEYYGNGVLYGDSSRFLQDSRILADIAYNQPLEYIKLLFGFADENSEIIWPYIEKTNIWMYGDNGDFINDNRLIIRLNSLIHLISNGNIYIHSLFHVFISFIGVKLLYQVFSNYVKQKKIFWYALVLIPSVSFWSGAILKESLLILGLGLLFYAISLALNKITIKCVIILFLSIGILLLNKPYVGLIVVPISFLWIFGLIVNWQIKYIYLSSLLIIFVFTVLLFAPSKINLTEKVSYKQKDLINIGKGGVFFINDTSFCAFDYSYVSNFEMVNDSLIRVNVPTKGEYKLFGDYQFDTFEIEASEKMYAHYLTQIPSTSYYEVTPIKNSSKQLMLNIPAAFVNVIIRPYFWDNGNKLKVFAFLQNIILIIFLFFCFLRRRKLKNNEKWLLFILLISSIFITLLIGWTTPIFGAIVRYKIPIDLFIIVASFILLKSKKDEKV
jgi:hypothetical protein